MSEQPASPAGVPQWDVADRMRKALREAGIGVQEIVQQLPAPVRYLRRAG